MQLLLWKQLQFDYSHKVVASGIGLPKDLANRADSDGNRFVSDDWKLNEQSQKTNHGLPSDGNFEGTENRHWKLNDFSQNHVIRLDKQFIEDESSTDEFYIYGGNSPMRYIGLLGCATNCQSELKLTVEVKFVDVNGEYQGDWARYEVNFNDWFSNFNTIKRSIGRVSENGFITSDTTKPTLTEVVVDLNKPVYYQLADGQTYKDYYFCDKPVYTINFRIDDENAFCHIFGVSYVEGKPQDFTFDWTEGNKKKYKDARVNLAYQNLTLLSEFIEACKNNATDSAIVTRCIEKILVKKDDSTYSFGLEFLMNIAIGSFEFMENVEFPFGGEIGGKIASWLLSGAAEAWRDGFEPTPQDLLKEFNTISAAIYQTLQSLKEKVDEICSDLEGHWWDSKKMPNTDKEMFVYQFAQGYGTKDEVRFPADNDPRWDLGIDAFVKKLEYYISMYLLPKVWSVYQNSPDFEDVFWEQQWYYKYWKNDPWQGPINYTDDNCLYHNNFHSKYCSDVWNIRPAAIEAMSDNEWPHYDHDSMFIWWEPHQIESDDWITNDHLYVGQLVHFSVLRRGDWDGDRPDSEFCKWLFKDDGFGNLHSDSDNSVAMRSDVFNNWGIKVNKIGGGNVLDMKKKRPGLLKRIYCKLFKKKCCCGCKN
jgi:hypothetical protein